MTRPVWRAESPEWGEPHHAVYFTDVPKDADPLAAFVAYHDRKWEWAVFLPDRSLSVQEGVTETLDAAKAEAEAALVVEGLADRVERAP